jgi:hypothetical protein
MCVSPSTRTEPKKRNSTGFSSNSAQLFPGKLHDLMTYVERNYLEAAISWVCDGRAFVVNDPKTLVDLLPIFFGQTKYRSFQRQLNLWHFEKIADGPARGAFRNPFFLKGKKELCSRMNRGHHLVKNTPSMEKMFEHTTADISILDNLGNSNDNSHYEDGDPLNFGGRQFFYVDARKCHLSLSLSDDPDGLIQTNKEDRHPLLDNFQDSSLGSMINDVLGSM